MKSISPLLIVLTLTASTLAPPVLAQDAPQTAPKSGYETLVAAGKLLLPGENGFPSSPFVLAPDENLRLQRGAVARNAPVLQLVRQALRQNIEVPPHGSYATMIIGEYAPLRELARQFIQESEVRLADGDAIGAMNSRLDCLEMGAALTHRAPLTAALVAMTVQSIGRTKIERVASRLDAAGCRAALQRLQTIQASRAPLLETLRNEKIEAITLSVNQIGNPQWKTSLAAPNQNVEAPYNEADTKLLLAMTPEALTASMTRFYDAEIERETLPFARSKTVDLPPATDPFSASSREILFSKPSVRFAFERWNLENRFFEAALELRAIKLETGAYPMSFNAGIDPFSWPLQPLKYQCDGASYRLYSIGPDGRDDGGAALETIVTNEQNGIKSLSNRPNPDATGDISAPFFG